MSETAIVIEDLSVRFGKKTILSNINARIPSGGCTVFVGPNGTGKTTLLLSLIGEVPYSGRISFASGLRRRIGLVPQNLKIDRQSPMSVAEFLAMGIQRRPLWLGLSRTAHTQLHEALIRVELADAEKTRLSDLSGGQMRRVLLASALLRRPSILLLDEPAAGVDLKGERLFWEILDKARTTMGMTVVMVSHNLPLAAHYATHVLCIHERTCIGGTPHEVLTATNLMRIFGVPIHLYPDQCQVPQHQCPRCGAFGMGDEAQVPPCPASGLPRPAPGDIPTAVTCACTACKGARIHD